MGVGDRPPIVVTALPRSESFSPVVGGGNERGGFQGDRGLHGRSLRTEFQAALDPTDRADDAAGSFVTFGSFPGLELALTSLDPQRSGNQPELVAVRYLDTPAGSRELATVFIPDGKRTYFVKKLQRIHRISRS